MNKNLTWREKTVIRILFLIAKLVAESPLLKDEVQSLANHISVNGKED